MFFKERFDDGLRRVYYYRDGSAASRLTPADALLERIGTPGVLVVSGLSLGLGRPEGLSAVVRRAVERFAAAGCHGGLRPQHPPRRVGRRPGA